MEQSTGETLSTGKIAEAALRNLYLDCFAEDDGPRPFASRMLHWEGLTLLIAPPHHQARPVELSPGEQVVCSCRLGREVLRFTACVGEVLPAVTNQAPAVRLCELEEPRTVEKRRYYRVSLGGRQPAEVSCWLVELDEEHRARVHSKFEGQLLDLSCGGVGVLARTEQPLEAAENRQLWIRFMLPTENESLIFRAGLRHIRPHDEEGQYHMGLEFLEYIEPGEHQEIIGKLARFVAGRQV